MPHRIAQLREKLAELEQVMADAGSLDETTRQSLQQTMDEINEALDAEETQEELKNRSPIDSLRKAAKDFEESHPTLSGTTRGSSPCWSP